MAGLALRHRNGNVASGCWQRPCSKNATRFSYEDWYGAGRVQRGFRDIQAFLDSWRRWSTSDPKWQSLDQSLPPSPTPPDPPTFPHRRALDNPVPRISHQRAEPRCVEPKDITPTNTMSKRDAQHIDERPISRRKRPAIQNTENGYPICLRNRHRGHKYEL